MSSTKLSVPSHQERCDVKDATSRPLHTVPVLQNGKRCCLIQSEADKKPIVEIVSPCWLRTFGRDLVEADRSVLKQSAESSIPATELVRIKVLSITPSKADPMCHILSHRRIRHAPESAEIRSFVIRG